MSKKSIHPDDVQLENNEKSTEFTRFWTDEQLRKAKLLSKKLYSTEFAAVEQYELRAERQREYVALVKPVTDREDWGLPEPEPPKVRIQIDTGCTVFEIHDNNNFP